MILSRFMDEKGRRTEVRNDVDDLFGDDAFRIRCRDEVNG